MSHDHHSTDDSSRLFSVTREDNTVSFNIRHAAKAVPRRGWTKLLCLFLPQALAVNSPALHLTHSLASRREISPPQ